MCTEPLQEVTSQRRLLITRRAQCIQRRSGFLGQFPTQSQR